MKRSGSASSVRRAPSRQAKARARFQFRSPISSISGSVTSQPVVAAAMETISETLGSAAASRTRKLQRQSELTADRQFSLVTT